MMFNTDIKRLGFACKYMHEDQSQPKRLLEEIERPLNTRATTVAWLNRQSRDVAEERLWEIMLHNTESARRLVEYVGTLPENRRMVRLSSDLLPVYTEPTWSYFWHRSESLMLWYLVLQLLVSLLSEPMSDLVSTPDNFVSLLATIKTLLTAV